MQQKVDFDAQKVKEALQEAQGEVETTFVTSTGCTVRVTPLPSLMMSRLFNKFPKPLPPIIKYTDESGREREEANESDPDYQEDLQKHTQILGDAWLKAVLLGGMQLEHLAPGVLSFDEDKDWTDELETIGFDIPESRAARYETWLRWRVLRSESDLKKLTEIQQRLSGIAEEDVQEALKSF